MKKSKPQNKQQQQKSSSPAKKQSRAGLRPRTAPGKAKTTFARAKAPVAAKKTAGGAPSKSINQKLAIKRLNKARETLQKAVKAVNDANKNLAKQMPTQQKKTLPAKQSKQNANAVSQQKKKQAIKRQQNNGKVQKRNNVRRGDVAIKISNRGPSGRGKGRVNVVRDTLKKEKPATSLDDRFSQLLKSASRTANRNRGGGGAGRRVSATGGGGAKRGGGGGGAPKRGGARSNRRY